MQESGYFRPTVLETMNRFLRSESLLLHCCFQISYDLRPIYTTDADQRWHPTEYSASLLRSSKTWQMQIQHVQSVKTSTDQCQHTLTGVTRWSNKTQRMCLLVQCEVGLCDVDQKKLSRFLEFISISIWIMILTQTDMLYSYKCILCEFETYFQRKPIRTFPKSCNMSLEQTYGKIHIYVYIYYIYMWVIKSNKTTCNMHFFGHQVLILFWTHLPCFFSILSVCMSGLFCSRTQFRRAAFWFVRIAYCGRLGRGCEKNHTIKWFRNRASSNHDFILISINRTALVWSGF